MRYVPDSKLATAGASIVTVWEPPLESSRKFLLSRTELLDDRVGEVCGVQTAVDTIETARLSPVDEETIAAPPASSKGELDEEPHDILDVAPDTPDEIVQAAFKEQVRDLEGHPDTGGSSDWFRKLETARGAMLDD